MIRYKSFLVLAFLILLSINCSKKSPVQPSANIPPDTWFLNVPRQTDTLPDRAILYWTGKDPDGKIIGYEYVIDDTTKQWIYITGDTTKTNYPKGDSLRLRTPTEDTIQFKVPNLVDVHTLYVRAIDDKGARDPDPASRSFTFKTIAPNTQITGIPNEGDTLYCLSGSTPTWSGIVFNVNTSDTMDPDGKVVGWYYAIDDSIPNRSTWKFITSPTCTLFNLSDGAHVFSISALDNADAIDPTPAKRHFWTWKPIFDSGILFVDETWNYNPPSRGKPSDAESDSVYDLIMRGTGRRYYFWENSDGTTPPPKGVLRRYSSVIWVSDEWKREGGSTILDARPSIIDYLNIGGKIWFIGHRLLAYLSSGADPRFKTYNADSFEMKYLGIKEADTDSAAEFVGGKIILPQFPAVLVDSNKVMPVWRGKLAYVNVIPKSGGSQAIYGFKSEPLNSRFENWPCAVYFTGSTFKTVFFTFPMYHIEINSSGEPMATVARRVFEYLGE